VRNIFLGLTLASLLANTAIFIMIMAALNSRGYKTNMLLVRIYFFKYLSAYKELTRKETGKPGLLYGLWILTINLTLVFAVAAILMRRG
jgi:hypothetical protein